MLNRPSIDADEEAILQFVRDWVALAASAGFEAALLELDKGDTPPWTQSLFEQITFDHFDDGKNPKITDPKKVKDLRIDAYEFNDGSGFTVDHDLALDDKRSDFTAQFEFKKVAGRYRICLTDIHVL